MPLQKDKFNLILSGGGALGYAHIGVIQFLHELELTPASLHGVSMGAIVASVYALPLSHEKKMAIFYEFFSIFKWLKFSWGGGKLVSNKKIYHILDHLFGSQRFSDLEQNLSILATNYDTGEATLFNKTNNNVLIKDAIMASMAIPAIFEPVKIDGVYYVDGYLSQNLPLMGIDNTLHNLLVNVTGSQSYKHFQEDEVSGISMIGNIERSVRILMSNQSKCILENFEHPYTLLEPQVSKYKTSHFHKIDAIMKTGYEEARLKL